MATGALEMGFQNQPNRKNRGILVFSSGALRSGLPDSITGLFGCLCCEVEEVSDRGRHCPLLEALRSSPRPVSGSGSMVNLLWITGSFENRRQTMDSKRKDRRSYIKLRGFVERSSETYLFLFMYLFI